MYPIASITVGAGGASSITFSSIPSTFTHLQLRISADMTLASSSGFGQLFTQFNGDTGQNYTRHSIVGDGATATSEGFATGTYNYVATQRFDYSSTVTNIYGCTIMDILDYTNTNKNKTIRGIGGLDANGTGQVFLYSSLWVNTAAISSISITPISGNTIRQYSTFMLYGISTSNVTGA
jgi:hypothetical protein